MRILDTLIKLVALRCDARTRPIQTHGLLLFLVDQHSLLPAARGLVVAVNATDPAAGSALAFLQLLAGSRDAGQSGLGLFGIVDPANEFIAAKRREVLPQLKNSRVVLQRSLQISLRLVHRAMRKFRLHIFRLSNEGFHIALRARRN